MHTSIRSAAALLLVLIVSPLQAQSGHGTVGGSLGPDVDFSLIVAREGPSGQQDRWIEAIILWRSATPGARYGQEWDPARLEAASRAYREAARSAADQDRFFLGSQRGEVVRTAEYDAATRRLHVVGEWFALAGRDSALVVMVVENRAGEHSLAGTAWVGSTLPEEAWGRSWASGDTLLFLRPRNREEHLEELLRRSEAVREFLATSPEIAIRRQPSASAGTAAERATPAARGTPREATHRREHRHG